MGCRHKDAFSLIVIVSSSTIRDHGYLARDPNLSNDSARNTARDPARDPSHHQLMRRRLTLPVQCSDKILSKPIFLPYYTCCLRLTFLFKIIECQIKTLSVMDSTNGIARKKIELYS